MKPEIRTAKGYTALYAELGIDPHTLPYHVVDGMERGGAKSLDGGEAEKFIKKLGDYSPEYTHNVLIDLEGVTFISDECLEAIGELNERYAKAGRQVLLMDIDWPEVQVAVVKSLKDVKMGSSKDALPVSG